MCLVLGEPMTGRPGHSGRDRGVGRGAGGGAALQKWDANWDLQCAEKRGWLGEDRGESGDGPFRESKQQACWWAFTLRSVPLEGHKVTSAPWGCRGRKGSDWVPGPVFREEGRFPQHQPTVLRMPAGCVRTELSFNTVYPEIASDPTGQGPSTPHVHTQKPATSPGSYL